MTFEGTPKQISENWWSITVIVDGQRLGYLFHTDELPRVTAEMEQN